MRIWDIGHDARLIAEISETPMGTFRAQFSLIDSVRDSESANQDVTMAEEKGVAPTAEPTDDRQSDEEDARTETTDPIGDVFREVLGASSSDDEQDEIVWNPRYVSRAFMALSLLTRHLSSCAVRCLHPQSPRFCQISLPHIVVLVV